MTDPDGYQVYTEHTLPRPCRRCGHTTWISLMVLVVDTATGDETPIGAVTGCVRCDADTVFKRMA